MGWGVSFALNSIFAPPHLHIFLQRKTSGTQNTGWGLHRCLRADA